MTAAEPARKISGPCITSEIDCVSARRQIMCSACRTYCAGLRVLRAHEAATRKECAEEAERHGLFDIANVFRRPKRGS